MLEASHPAFAFGENWLRFLTSLFDWPIEQATGIHGGARPKSDQDDPRVSCGPRVSELVFESALPSDSRRDQARHAGMMASI